MLHSLKWGATGWAWLLRGSSKFGQQMVAEGWRWHTECVACCRSGLVLHKDQYINVCLHKKTKNKKHSVIFKCSTKSKTKKNPKHNYNIVASTSPQAEAQNEDSIRMFCKMFCSTCSVITSQISWIMIMISKTAGSPRCWMYNCAVAELLKQRIKSYVSCCSCAEMRIIIPSVTTGVFT